MVAATDTKDRIVEAALESLKAEGYAGTSARSIAGRGGFNQALIFYHFGSIKDLLLAALDRTSADRMSAYRAAVEGVTDLPGLVAVAGRIYHQDLETGHIKVLAELIAGASADPELGPEIVARIEPWIGFAREVIQRVSAGSPVGAFVPADDLAYAVVAQFLGLELLTHLEKDTARAERLLDLARAVAALASSALPIPPVGGDPS